MSEPQQPIVLPPGSGPAGPPSNVPQRRPRRVGDTIGSIVVLLFAMGAYVVGLLISLAVLGVTDRCTTCNLDGAVAVQSASVIVLAIVLLVGAVVTLLFAIVLRRRAWPIALATLLVIVVGWLVGGITFYVTLSS